MIITKFEEVKKIYEDAAKKGWVLPCLCSENQTTTEAILEACSEYGKKLVREYLSLLQLPYNTLTANKL